MPDPYGIMTADEFKELYYSQEMSKLFVLHGFKETRKHVEIREKWEAAKAERSRLERLNMKGIFTDQQKKLDACRLLELLTIIKRIKEDVKLALDIVNTMNPSLILKCKENWAGTIWDALDVDCQFRPSLEHRVWRLIDTADELNRFNFTEAQLLEIQKLIKKGVI